MKIFRRSLIGFLITVVILFVGFFTASIFTYPNGAKAAFSNLDDATGLLFYKMVGSETQVSNLEEQIAGETNWQPKPGEIDELYPDENYPYSAQLPSDAQGKIEILYDWEISNNVFTLSLKTKNIANVQNMELTDLYARIVYKDINGSEMDSVFAGIGERSGNFGVWQYSHPPGYNLEEPSVSTLKYDDLPKEFIDKIVSIELIIY
jgi:hypothetical protein